ncbi:MAG: Coenzyme F420 hydrogenase/dehydrogenase, beta subunit C-terminal domain [Fusicatenibacter saccharivorans]
MLAQEVLKRKGIVYGCAMLYENQNLVIKHIGIDKIEELCKLKGSKYVQSNLENVYVEIKRHLEHNETVLFSGTPCQIAGLRGYLQRTYANLYTIEIICHGVPSAKLFQNYLGYIESKEGKK